jgi:hypothetical protein
VQPCNCQSQSGLGAKRVTGMVNTQELIAAICKVIETSPVPVPIAFMNHGVDEAAAIIGGVVERCARESIALKRVSIDPELAEELGLQGDRTRSPSITRYDAQRTNYVNRVKHPITKAIRDMSVIAWIAMTSVRQLRPVLFRSLERRQHREHGPLFLIRHLIEEVHVRVYLLLRSTPSAIEDGRRGSYATVGGAFGPFMTCWSFSIAS